MSTLSLPIPCRAMIFSRGRVGDLVPVEGLGAEQHGVDGVAHLLVGDGGRAVAEVHLAELVEFGEHVGVDGVGDVEGRSW